MSLKDLKSVLFKDINEDFNKNKDAYMFYLYPLVFKIKTKKFDEKCYSLFSKIKKEKVKKFDFYKINKYLKKDYCNDIKIILKTIFQSSYLTKNNEYALDYIKKLTKKPSTMKYINLIYRLLSDVKDNKKANNIKMEGGGGDDDDVVRCGCLARLMQYMGLRKSKSMRKTPVRGNSPLIVTAQLGYLNNNKCPYDNDDIKKQIDNEIIPILKKNVIDDNNFNSIVKDYIETLNIKNIEDYDIIFNNIMPEFDDTKINIFVSNVINNSIIKHSFNESDINTYVLSKLNPSVRANKNNYITRTASNITRTKTLKIINNDIYDDIENSEFKNNIDTALKNITVKNIEDYDVIINNIMPKIKNITDKTNKDVKENIIVSNVINNSIIKRNFKESEIKVYVLSKINNDDKSNKSKYITRTASNITKTRTLKIINNDKYDDIINTEFKNEVETLLEQIEITCVEDYDILFYNIMPKIKDDDTTDVKKNIIYKTIIDHSIIKQFNQDDIQNYFLKKAINVNNEEKLYIISSIRKSNIIKKIIPSEDINAINKIENEDFNFIIKKKIETEISISPIIEVCVKNLRMLEVNKVDILANNIIDKYSDKSRYDIDELRIQLILKNNANADTIDRKIINPLIYISDNIIDLTNSIFMMEDINNINKMNKNEFVKAIDSIIPQPDIFKYMSQFNVFFDKMLNLNLKNEKRIIIINKIITIFNSNIDKSNADNIKYYIDNVKNITVNEKFNILKNILLASDAKRMLSPGLSAPVRLVKPRDTSGARKPSQPRQSQEPLLSPRKSQEPLVSPRILAPKRRTSPLTGRTSPLNIAGGKGIIKNHKLHYLMKKIYKNIKILTVS